MTPSASTPSIDGSTAPCSHPPPLADDAFIGRTLGDKYTLTRLLGCGGFGAVYHALQAPIDRPVAIKLIRHSPHDPAELRRRFALEARALARVSSHPNCAALIELGEEPDGLLYLVQDFIDGRPLDAVLREDGPLSPARAVMIAGAVLDALDTAHHHGIVHRDIKPSNVMLLTDHRGRERVELLDFGIAHVVGEARGGISPTATGVIVGSPQYMAPEQFSGAGISPRVDLYAVGVLLYELLTGAPPFEGTAVELMHHHISCPPRPIGPVVAVPAGLERALDRALRKDPGARFGDAAEMRDVLFAALATSEPAAQRRSAAPVAVTAALVVTGAFAALPLWRSPPLDLDGAGVVDPDSGTDAVSAMAPVDAGEDATLGDVTPEDALADARLDDASTTIPKARRRARPAPPEAPIDPAREQLAAALDRCDCATATGLYAALADDPDAAPLRARFEDECRRLDQACLGPK